VVVKSMGYNTLNGASATAISALTKYGLLEGRGTDIRISERALQILHPQSAAEKAEALRAAARDPALFQELFEKFPGQTPNEEVLRNYLVRAGFAPVAVPAAILAFRETNEFVEREVGPYDSGSVVAQPEAAQMQLTTSAPQVLTTTQMQKSEVLQPIERQVGRWDFEGGSYIRIVIGGSVDTAAALEEAELIIQRKRRELDRLNAVRSNLPAPDEKG